MTSNQRAPGVAGGLAVIILTKNEGQHINRAIGSVQDIASRVYVVDSGSSDRTRELASRLGAEVLEHAWLNYSSQFNWALEQLQPDDHWVLRLDADEVLDSDLRLSIADVLSGTRSGFDAYEVNRRMAFLGKPIRWGGVFPIKVVRLFRRGRGQCEQRWMDEHIITDGPAGNLDGELLDDNRNSLTWWVDKHNWYASREVVDILNAQHHFSESTSVARRSGAGQAGVKRWLKEQVYNRLPLGSRALIYAFYRVVLRAGFLDGPRGLTFHVLQGFWYRYLVDAKLLEANIYMRDHGVTAPEAVQDLFGIQVEAEGRDSAS